MKKSTSKLLKKVIYMTGMLLAICLLTVYCSIMANAESTGAQVTLADGTVSNHATLEEAIAVASENDGSTVKLLADATATEAGWFNITKGNFTIDLNGFDMIAGDDDHTSILMQNANVTMVDESEEPGRLPDLLNVVSGTLTIKGGSYLHVLPHDESYIYIEGGVFDEHLHYLPENTFISGGTFASVTVAEGLSLSDILVEDHYFFDENGNIVRTEDKEPEGGLYKFSSLTVLRHGEEDHTGGTGNCITLKICDVCGNEYGTYDPEGHSWDNGAVTEEPNCSEVGTRTYTCLHNAAHTKTEDIDIVADAHSWDNGAVTEEPNCSEVGTRTYTCLHNAAHTRTEDIDIVADAHSWDNGTVTKEPTCTEKGTKTFTCAHNAQHTRTEDIDSLGGHKYDNACDADCNVCSATRTPAAHQSENADGKCDVCGESFKLSGGEIAGIAVGSTALVGAGGFSLFWFLFKKKKQSDLDQ